MKLNEIYLKEAADPLYEFVLKKWDGNQPDGLHVEPFDVLVKYHGESGGSSEHPYGEGTATEQHGDTITVVSITANEPVRVFSEFGPHFETLKDHEDLHALVIGKVGTGKLHRVRAQFPDAIVLSGNATMKGTAGALQLFSFFEDHHDDDVIIDVDNSPMLNDIYCVNVLKEILDGQLVHFKGAHAEKEFKFTGRIVIVASDVHEINDAIKHRCVVIDLTKDKTYPRGTPVQEIPGWEESSLKFFEDKAHDDFIGNQE